MFKAVAAALESRNQGLLNRVKSTHGASHLGELRTDQIVSASGALLARQEEPDLVEAEPRLLHGRDQAQPRDRFRTESSGPAVALDGCNEAALFVVTNR